MFFKKKVLAGDLAGYFCSRIVDRVDGLWGELFDFAGLAVIKNVNEIHALFRTNLFMAIILYLRDESSVKNSDRFGDFIMQKLKSEPIFFDFLLRDRPFVPVDESDFGQLLSDLREFKLRYGEGVASKILRRSENRRGMHLEESFALLPYIYGYGVHYIVNGESEQYTELVTMHVALISAEFIALHNTMKKNKVVF